MANQGSKLMNFIAFCAVLFIGLALMIAWIFSESGQFAGALNLIAQILAYIVVAYYSFMYAHRKWERKRVWFLIAWVAAVVLIIIFVILPLF